MDSKKIIASLLSIFVLNLCSGMEIVVPVDNFAPWKVIEKGGYKGIDIEIIEAVVKAYNSKFSTDHTIKYVTCPWIRCLDLMKRGRADLFSGVLLKENRQDYMEYLHPPYKSHSAKALYKNTKSSLKVRKLEDLYGVSVGAVNGALYDKKFDSNPKIKRMYVVEHKKLIEMLIKERFDLIIGTESHMDYLLSNEIRDKLIKKVDFKFKKKKNVFLTISKKSQLYPEAGKFKMIVEDLKRRGVFKRIIINYFEKIKRPR